VILSLIRRVLGIVSPSQTFVRPLRREAERVAKRLAISADDAEHGLELGLTSEEVERCVVGALLTGHEPTALFSMAARAKEEANRPPWYAARDPLCPWGSKDLRRAARLERRQRRKLA
jgi:hypothetical protein